MVQKKKKSQRVPLHKKYKIERKIRAHHKKVRRLARKNKSYIKRKAKKDPGIPNSWPFKQEMLQEAREQKQKLLELQEAQKTENQKERDRMMMENEADNTNDSMTNGDDDDSNDDGDDNYVFDYNDNNKTNSDYISNKIKPKTSAVDITQLAQDASKRGREFVAKENDNKQLEGLSTELSGIPGITMQAYYREFRKVVEAADIILEVLDARDPLGCRCPDVEKMITSKYPNKRIVLLLNKIDLAPREVVEGWLKYLRNEYPTIAFKCSRQLQRKKLGRSTLPVAHAKDEALQGSSCLGADTLLQLLKHYSKTGAVQTSVTVGIVGFPNVGKSSVINSLCRTRAVRVGGTPGVTRTAQEVHLDKHVKLLDSPGIVFPKSTDVDNDVILRHCVQIEKVPDPISPVEAILRRVNKRLLLQVYKIPDFADANEFLRHIAKKLGKIGKGGVSDFKAAARKVLQDWVFGKVPFYTEAPAVDQSIHLGAEIVSEWGDEFDFSQEAIISSLPPREDYDGQALQGNASTTETAPILHNEDSDAHSVNILDEDTIDEDMFDDEEEDTERDYENSRPDDAISDAMSTTSSKSKKAKVITSNKQDLSDEADQYNPQFNRSSRKQQQKEKKKKNKQQKKVVHSRDDADAYNFKTDFPGGDIEIEDIS